VGELYFRPRGRRAMHTYAAMRAFSRIGNEAPPTVQHHGRRRIVGGPRPV